MNGKKKRTREETLLVLELLLMILEVDNNFHNSQIVALSSALGRTISSTRLATQSLGAILQHVYKDWGSHKSIKVDNGPEFISQALDA